jgi:hypothetical protein
VIGAAVALAAACGGSSSGGSSGSSGGTANGEAAKPAAQILADARKAALAASSVHVAGGIAANDGRITLDVSLLGSRGGKGRLAINGLGFQIIRIGNTAYFSGTEAFYRRFANSAAAALLKGRWVKASSSSSQFASFAQLTDMRNLVGAALRPEGTPTKAGTRTYHGTPVVALRDSSGGGTLYVATQGPPYPVAIVDPARSSSIAFDHWGEPVSLAAPADALDLSQLGQGG